MDIFDEVINFCSSEINLSNGHKDAEKTDYRALRFKSAFNLVQLHRLLGNNEKAIEYLELYLTF